MTNAQPRFMNLLLLAVAALSAAVGPLHAADPNNPPPCTEWSCVDSASVTKVTVAGPTTLKIGENGTWTATAETSIGKQVCLTSGATRDCPVTSVKWSMSAGDQSGASNTITRSWAKAGTYTVSATGEPISDCCPGSGTSGNLTVVVACVASPWKTESELDIAKIVLGREQKIAEKLKNVPWVREATIKLVGKVKGSTYEKCCGDDSEPREAFSYSGTGGVSGTISFYLVGGRYPYYARIGGWFTGEPYGAFHGEVQGGIFGGATLAAQAVATYKQECETCATFVITGDLSGFIGADLKGKGTIYTEKRKYECEASATAYATATGKAGLFGKAYDCFEPLKITGCFDGVKFQTDIVFFCNFWDYGMKFSWSKQLMAGNCK